MDPQHSTTPFIPSLKQSVSKEREKSELITRDQIIQLMKMVDSRLAPDQEVISFFQDLIEDYVEVCMEDMMLFTKHRADNTVDFRDAKLYYERSFSKCIPGIMNVSQQQHPPTDSIVKTIHKKKPHTKTYLNRLQDFKKSKK
ncbi:Transcription initiation factor TFIID subunit 12 domain-containing protein [Entamoeba marina]